MCQLKFSQRLFVSSACILISFLVNIYFLIITKMSGTRGSKQPRFSKIDMYSDEEETDSPITALINFKYVYP